MMEKTMTAQCEIAAKMYKNMKMGSDSITKLLDKVQDGQLKSRMMKQMNGYEGFAAKAKMMLSDNGEEAKEESPMTKFWATVGMKMNTLMDSSKSHIAEMMIRGTVMGITALRTTQTDLPINPDPEVEKLLSELIDLEENYEQRLKEFL